MRASYETHGEGRQAVVFLHGIGSSKEGWAAQREAVVEAGWKFVAVDAPGYGETPLPDAPGFEPHDDAIRATLDQLGLAKAVICGHSLGGMTAQEFHATHPDRVSGLILSATSPAFGRPDGDFQKEFVRQRLEPFEQGMSMEEVARSTARLLVAKSARARAVETIAEDMAKVPVPAYTLAVRTLTAFDQRANLPNITVPTLLIAGEEDTNSPAPMMRKMAEKIPEAEYVELKKTGHMGPVENPVEFNREVVKFLRKIPATP